MTCFDREWNAVPNQSTEDREGSFHIFSSALLNTKISISNRSSAVSMDKRQFLEHILYVARREIIMNIIHKKAHLHKQQK